MIMLVVLLEGMPDPQMVRSQSPIATPLDRSAVVLLVVLLDLNSVLIPVNFARSRIAIVPVLCSVLNVVVSVVLWSVFVIISLTDLSSRSPIAFLGGLSLLIPVVSVVVVPVLILGLL